MEQGVNVNWTCCCCWFSQFNCRCEVNLTNIILKYLLFDFKTFIENYSTYLLSSVNNIWLDGKWNNLKCLVDDMRPKIVHTKHNGPVVRPLRSTELAINTEAMNKRLFIQINIWTNERMNTLFGIASSPEQGLLGWTLDHSIAQPDLVNWMNRSFIETFAWANERTLFIASSADQYKHFLLWWIEINWQWRISPQDAFLVVVNSPN